MTTRSFLVATLGLPLIVGAIAYVLPSQLGAVLFVPLLVGAIPYIPFAVLIAFLIKRTSSRKMLVVLSLVVPPAFSLWLTALTVAFSIQPGYEAQRVLEDSAPLSLYALAYGYSFVALAWALWAAAKRLGLVLDEFAT